MVVGVVIRLPPEAMVPLLIGLAALALLLFAGRRFAEWKARSPASAATFGLGAAALLTAGALFLLYRCLTNQSDPNNEGVGQINFTDAPIAGFLAGIAALFWRMGNQRFVGVAVGGGLGALMIAKPFLWPVIRVYTDDGGGRSARDLIDPEHIMFLGPGVFAIILGLAALLRPAVQQTRTVVHGRTPGP
jgi:hypothetical protein